MSIRAKCLKIFIALLVIITLSAAYGCLGVPQDEYERLKAELAEAQARIAQIQKDLETERANYESAQRELETARTKLAELEKSLETEQSKSERNQEEAAKYRMRVADLEQQLAHYQTEVAKLEESIAQLLAEQYVPTHDIELTEIETNAVYWNAGWKDTPLLLNVKTINTKYFQTHTYVQGETDENDMVIDIWYMLRTGGISSVIVWGNLNLTGESFEECDHAWLLVPNYRGVVWALEYTKGETYTRWDARANPQLEQYWEGFFYAKPSDLRADLEQRP
jgi:hypothetical protein